jgi:hypothetical protein
LLLYKENREIKERKIFWAFPLPFLPPLHTLLLCDLIKIGETLPDIRSFKTHWGNQISKERVGVFLLLIKPFLLLFLILV